MTKPTCLPAPTVLNTPGQGCPFRWREQCSVTECTRPNGTADDEARYIQVRRQGLYLAACVVDDVAGLGIRNADAVIDEIRRRLCELVRYELNKASER